MKSFRKDRSDEPTAGGRNGERDFHGKTRSNDTHASTTDPEARLYRKGKGKETRFSCMGNVADRERHGPGGRGRARLGDRNYRTRGSHDGSVRHSQGPRRLTLGADKVTMCTR
jgi:hypothetical protein